MNNTMLLICSSIAILTSCSSTTKNRTPASENQDLVEMIRESARSSEAKQIIYVGDVIEVKLNATDPKRIKPNIVDENTTNEDLGKCMISFWAPSNYDKYVSFEVSLNYSPIKYHYNSQFNFPHDYLSYGLNTNSFHCQNGKPDRFFYIKTNCKIDKPDQESFNISSTYSRYEFNNLGFIYSGKKFEDTIELTNLTPTKIDSINIKSEKIYKDAHGQGEHPAITTTKCINLVRQKDK